MENKNRCMMCSYFKRTDKDLPDFGMCTKNDFEVVSSDLACGDFDYALCGKCKNYNPCEFDKHHGYCQKNWGNKVVYGRAICDKFEPKEAQKCCCEYKTEGRYPWGSDEDKVLKYCANDVVIIAEQMAREKQKELEEKAKLKEEIERLKNQVKNLQTTNEESYKREEKLEDKVHKLERRLNEKVCRMKRIDCELIMPLIRVLYPGEKVYKPYSEVINDIKNLKEEIERLKKSQEELENKLNTKNKDIDILLDENKRLQWRNDNQSKMIQDLKKERDEIDDKYGKLKFKFCDMLQEKGELEETNNRYYKDNERLAKKNRELQIRVNDLLFQEKLNKSAFGYDYEEENGKLRVENEHLRNMVKSQRNRSSSYYYSALKAEDKIEHIQKEAKKWKNKYKEAYDILETYFKYDLNGMEYDVSYDDINLKLRYSTPNGDKGNKYNALVSAYERLKKL